MSKKINPRLILRFSGRGGKARLVEAFKNQQLVSGNTEIATKLVKCSQCHEFKPCKTVMVEGNGDTDIYFILSGSVSITVKGRQIASRKAGEHIGEMALIDTTAVRSATICTLEQTVLAKISESKFTQIANAHPELWRKIAVYLGARLRERSKFHTPPRIEPVIFIGSSSEGAKVAEKIDRYLQRFPFVPKLWTQDVFECSNTTIEDLMAATKNSDFSILVLTADDVVKSRGKAKPSPRDNVIFELGLFMGAISRERTFIVAPKNANLKIPTDLLGVTCLLYKKQGGKSLSENMRPVLRKLRDLICKRGPI